MGDEFGSFCKCVNSVATIEARALKEGRILACQVGCAKMIIKFF